MKTIKFKQGDVLLFSWQSIPGVIIKLHNIVAKGKNGWRWTHAAIIGEVKKYSVVVYEATSKGFIKSEYGKAELTKYVKSKNCIKGTTKQPLTEVLENCEKYLGRPYGWIDILSIGLYLVFGKLSFNISTKSKNLICSEAVARILYDSSDKKLDFEKEFNKSFDLITPQNLYNSKQIKW